MPPTPKHAHSLALNMRAKRALPPPPPLSARAGRITGKLGKKFGFADPGIIEKWPLIMGETLAQHAVPERLTRRPGEGVLTLRVENGAAAAHIQHMAGVILERVNQHYGWKVVGRLRIVQGPLSGKVRQTPKKRPAPPAMSVADAEKFSKIGDPDLRLGLARLAAHVKRRARQD